MANEGGEWILYGVARDDPRRLASPEALLAHVDDVGFLPLFKNDVPGFSVEERTCPEDWWTGDPARDPWEWRELLARSGRVAYGKFFDKKAGFISLRWLPAFANCRRIERNGGLRQGRRAQFRRERHRPADAAVSDGAGLPPAGEQAGGALRLAHRRVRAAGERVGVRDRDGLLRRDAGAIPFPDPSAAGGAVPHPGPPRRGKTDPTIKTRAALSEQHGFDL